MINVTVGELKTQNVKPFPKLMISNDGLIVLFTSEKSGTVVSINQEYEMGYYCGIWKISVFTDYNSTITLQNA